jgi:hypothetical protein
VRPPSSALVRSTVGRPVAREQARVVRLAAAGKVGQCERGRQSRAVVKMRGRRCVHPAGGDPTEVTRVARNGGWGAEGVRATNRVLLPG